MELSNEKGIRLDIQKMAESPSPYTMSYGFSLDVLCESIRKVGLINPPLVAQNQEGTFEIVTGYRRILALKTLGESEGLCRDVTTVLVSPLQRLLANFYENLATRVFNDIEKALILHKLHEYVTKDEILSSFMPLLSLPSHEGTVKLYLKLLDLEEDLQKAIAQKEISMNAAKALIEMEKNSQHILLQWTKVLKFNFNQQIKFIEYSLDIGIREGISIPQLLSEDFFLQLAGNARLNNPQKAKAALEALRERRFPRLGRAQQAIERAVSRIAMPPEASVHYDPYLEDPYYRLEIKFKHGKDLKRTIGNLDALHELEAIPELWIDR